MALDDRAHDVLPPLRPNRRRRSALHLGATFMRLLVLVGALIVFGSAWTALTGRAVISDGGPAAYLTLDFLPQLQQVTAHGDGVIRIVDLPLWVRLLAYAPGVITGVVMVLVALTTTRVLVAIAAARPFAVSTARHVRTAGLLMAVGGTLAGALDSTAVLVFLRTQVGGPHGWQATYDGLGFTGGDWPWTLIITGVVVTAVAAAFTEGARLQQEIDEVV